MTECTWVGDYPKFFQVALEESGGGGLNPEFPWPRPSVKAQ